MTRLGSNKIVESDFSVQFRSAYNKYTLAVTISIFISLFDLSDSQTIFGFSVEDFNERIVEVFGLSIAMFLGLNLVLRFLDERKTLSDIEAGIKNFKINVSTACEGVESDLARFEVAKKSLNRLSSDSERALDEAKRLESIINQIPSTNLSPIDNRLLWDSTEHGWHSQIQQSLPRAITKVSEVLSLCKNLISTLMVVDSNFSQFQASFESYPKQFNDMSTKLDAIKSSVLTDKEFGKWARTRIWIIEVFTPIFLIIFALIAFVFPDSVYKIILSLSRVV